MTGPDPHKELPDRSSLGGHSPRPLVEARRMGTSQAHQAPKEWFPVKSRTVEQMRVAVGIEEGLVTIGLASCERGSLSPISWKEDRKQGPGSSSKVHLSHFAARALSSRMRISNEHICYGTLEVLAKSRSKKRPRTPHPEEFRPDGRWHVAGGSVLDIVSQPSLGIC